MLIFSLTNEIQKTFLPILVTQFIVILPNIVSTIRLLAVNIHQIDFFYVASVFCTLSVFMEVYMFCRLGNEVSLNVIQIVYKLSRNITKY